MLERHENPYIAALNIPVIKIITGVTKNEESGEYEVGDYLVEADKYCRVYTTPARRKIIFNLSPKARDLYLYIIYTMNDNYEHVNLSYCKFNEFHKECGAERDASPRGFRESIKELVQNNIIDVKQYKSESYWISPHYFFPGNRLEKYPENVVIVRTYDKRTDYEKHLG